RAERRRRLRQDARDRPARGRADAAGAPCAALDRPGRRAVARAAVPAVARRRRARRRARPAPAAPCDGVRPGRGAAVGRRRPRGARTAARRARAYGPRAAVRRGRGPPVMTDGGATAPGHDVTQVATPDGRVLEVLDIGPADGMPLLFHWGTPQGAVPFGILERPALERGMRVLAWSRPGYG